MLRDFAKQIGYDDPLEIYLSQIESLLLSEYRISKRALALLLVQEDKEMLAMVENKEKERIDKILKIIQEAKAHYVQPLAYIISLRRQKEASRIAEAVMSFKPGRKITLREIL